MTNGKKILLITGILAVGVGGFALTMYLTRKVNEKKMSIIYKNEVKEIVEDYDVFNDPNIK
jgi:uncharacterized membrane protein SpoIIM required for sporulation